MAFVRKRGSKFYVGFRYQGKQREFSYESAEEAREAKEKVEACMKLQQDPLQMLGRGENNEGTEEVETISPKTDVHITMDEALDQFERIKGTLSVVEMNSLRAFNTFLDEEMQIYYLHQIKVTHLRMFQDRLKKQKKKDGQLLSFSTVNKYFKPIREFLVSMYELDLLANNICANVKSLRGTYNKRTPWTEDQFIAVINLVMTWARRILITMYVTGCRPIMLARLTWKDVDFTRGAFKVHSFKGGMSKTLELPMNGILAEVFSKQLEEARSKKRGAADDLVFPGPDGKSQFKSHTLLNEVKRKAEKAGLQGRVVPYALRNTFGTSMVSAGVPMKTVANLMGHEDTRTTEGYVGSIRESELDASNIAAQKFSKLGIDI